LAFAGESRQGTLEKSIGEAVKCLRCHARKAISYDFSLFDLQLAETIESGKKALE
jgi:hypothetical protein